MPTDRINVYTKTNWTDSWTERDHLWPEMVREGLEPNIPEAVLRWRYGHIVHQGASTFVDEDTLDILDHFVRIDWIDGDGGAHRWHGILTDVTYDAHPVAADGTKSGDQVFRARGLAHLLDRIVLYIAAAYQSGASDYLTHSGLKWAPTFNLRDNRTAQILGNGYHWDTGEVQFGSPEWSETSEWTFREIIEYLLRVNWDTGWAEMNWTLVDNTAAADLEQLVEVVEQEGWTIRQVLNHLVKPERGYAWHVTVPDDESEVRVEIVSAFTDDVTSGGVTFHANASQDTWDFTEDLWLAGPPQIVKSTSGNYDLIAAIGRPLLTCFTLSGADLDATLYNDYASGAYTRYWDAASGATGYSDLNPEEKAEINDRFRAGTTAIYSYYVPANAHPGGSLWDWYAGDGAGGSLWPANPLYSWNATDGGVLYTGYLADYYPGRGGRQFETWLPLREGVDYSQNHFPQQDMTGEAGFRKPEAYVKDINSGRYCRADEPERADVPAAQVRVDDKELGVHIRFNPPHILSERDASGQEPSRWNRVYDRDTLVATVAVRTDQRLIAYSYAEGYSPSSTTIRRTLAIAVDDAELWYVLPGTVVGVDADGALEKVTAPKGQRILRDDRARLQRIADLAAEWYGRTHGAVRATYNKLDTVKSVGTLITTAQIGSYPVLANSLISEIVWDFVAGTTTYSTDFYELDARGLSRLPDYRLAWRRIQQQQYGRYLAGEPS